jgi:ubiquinone/menaquinone biosynthesis C-methylase UbiE
MEEIEKGVRRHFDEISADYYSIVNSTPFLYGYYHEKEVSFIRKAIRDFLNNVDSAPELPPMILDIGCATGRVIRSIRTSIPSAQFVGLDLSRNMIRLGKAVRDALVEFVVADIRCLPFRNDTFHFVYSLEVIEHLNDKAVSVPRAVSEVIRVTRENGHVTLESTSTLHFRFQEFLRERVPDLHASLFQPESKFLESHRKAPLEVAEPSAFERISGLIASGGGKVRTVSWIRVLPEQTFILVTSSRARRILTMIDEVLTRIPTIKFLGREFLLCAKKLQG